MIFIYLYYFSLFRKKRSFLPFFGFVKKYIYEKLGLLANTPKVKRILTKMLIGETSKFRKIDIWRQDFSTVPPVTSWMIPV